MILRRLTFESLLAQVLSCLDCSLIWLFFWLAYTAVQFTLINSNFSILVLRWNYMAFICSYTSLLLCIYLILRRLTFESLFAQGLSCLDCSLIWLFFWLACTAVQFILINSNLSALVLKWNYMAIICSYALLLLCIYLIVVHWNYYTHTYNLSSYVLFNSAISVFGNRDLNMLTGIRLPLVPVFIVLSSIADFCCFLF